MRLLRGLEWRRLGAALSVVAIFTFAVGGLALAAITPTGDAAGLAAAIATDPSVVSGASFVAVPPGTPNAVADSGTPLGGFPTAGTTYAILTTGDPALADDPNSSASSGIDLEGPSVRGDTDFDVSILKIDLNVPAGRNCLTFDFRFLSEEFPEFVGTDFNDAFIAELDNSTWDTSGSVITAPNNFATDPTGNVISINAAGAASMSAGSASGTTYDGATPLLSASSPITSGAHSLFLSIFDQGDGIYDSAVFLDGLILGTTAAGACQAGATVLSTSKTADSPTSPVGGTNGYSITISNPSGSAVTLNSIFDILPAGFSYVAGSTTGVTTANPGIAGQTLTWTGPFNVPANGSVNLQFDVVVSSTPGVYLNDAGGEAASGAVSPTGPTAQITVTDVAPGSADLAITKSDSPDPVLVGQELTYTLTVSNAGPDSAANVTVTDTLPAGVTFVSAVANQGTCTGTATVSCSLGAVASGGTATVTIKVIPTSDADLNNTATVASATSDPVPGNNSDTESTVVEMGAGSADLAITKSDSPDPVLVGQELTYTLTVSNAGPDSAANVTVTDTLPAGVTFVSAVANQGTCTGTATVSCSLGAVASGGTATVTIKVIPTSDADLNNTATVASATSDPVPGNNSDTESTVVDPCVVGPTTTTTTTTVQLSTTTTSEESTTSTGAQESTTTSSTTATSHVAQSTTTSSTTSTTQDEGPLPDDCAPPNPTPTSTTPTNPTPTNPTPTSPTPTGGSSTPVNVPTSVGPAQGEGAAVLGIQATAPVVAQVTNPTSLPLTGISAAHLALLAASLAGMGFLALLAARADPEEG